MVETKQLSDLIKSVRIEKSMSQKHSLVQSYINKEGNILTIGITDGKTVSMLVKMKADGEDGSYTVKTQDIVNIFESSPYKYYIALKDGKLTAKNQNKLRMATVTQSPRAKVLKMRRKSDNIIEVDTKSLGNVLLEAMKVSSDSSNIGFFIEDGQLHVVSVAEDRGTFYRGRIPCGGDKSKFSILSIYTFSRVISQAEKLYESENSIWCESTDPSFLSANLKVSISELLETAKDFNTGKKLAVLNPESTKEIKQEVRTAAAINATPKSVPNVSMKISGSSMEISLYDYSGGGSEATEIKLKEDTKIELDGVIKPSIIPFVDVAESMNITLSKNMYLLVMKTKHGTITTVIGRKAD